ncbi:hypothetical protein LTR53_013500 [Teratosphaeriaceae sp. CCFEE 6253]|nr:hypothetical protein LTR53_013500 [Teratosphaeriaceae sp. CCFEE 6253]
MELRMEIYEYLLQPDQIELLMFENPTFVGLWPEEIDRNRVYHRPSERRAHVHHTSILETCSRIRNEAQSILYQPTKLKIQPSRWDEMPNEDAAAMGARLFNGPNLHHIRSLQLLHILVAMDGESKMTEIVAHLRYFARKLSNLRRIEGFVLELVCPLAFPKDESAKSLLDCITSMCNSRARHAQGPRAQIIFRPYGYDDSVAWYAERFERIFGMVKDAFTSHSGS